MQIINAMKIMLGSILKNDLYILGFAVFTLFVMIVTAVLKESIRKDSIESRVNPEKRFTKWRLKGLSKCNSVFVACISLFPLLGMFGTVAGLLNLNISSGDMEDIKTNFFVALTSTGWGIIFSFVFKIVYAFMVDDIEKQIEVSNKILEDIETEEVEKRRETKAGA